MLCLGAKEGLSFPVGKNPAGLPPVQEQEDWQQGWLARNPTFWFQSDNETQQAKDESNLSGSVGSPDGIPSPSQQTEFPQSVSQSQTLEQQEALEGPEIPTDEFVGLAVEYSQEQAIKRQIGRA